MTARNTIAGPGARIPTAGGEFTTAVSRCPVIALAVGFPVVPRAAVSPLASAGVRILPTGRSAAHVRPTAARAESRDATERSRAGSRSRAARWRPAQADGGRSDGARPSLRAHAASSRRFTGTRRSSAARRVFVTVDRPNQVVIPRSPAGAHGSANAHRPRSGAAMDASLARPQTLPISVRGTASPLQKNTAVFL